MNTPEPQQLPKVGGSELNVQLETPVDWAIIFDDKDRPAEFFTDCGSALNRFDALAMSWNCHLFKRVDVANVANVK